MLAPACCRWTASVVIAVACSALWAHRVLAQDESALQRAIQSADQQLNDDYKTLIRSLSPRAIERLRIAERAWLVFLSANEAAVREIARNQINAPTFVLSARLLEIQHRREELRGMFGQPPSAPSSISLSAADAELNQVYQGYLRTLSAAGERRLREAQRAWIDFRDKQTKADAASTANVSPASLLTQHRIASLKAYLDPASAVTSSTIRPSRPTVDSSIPDPFASAR